MIPEILVSGSNGSTNGLVDGLLSMILWNQTGKQGEVTPTPLHPQPVVKTPSTPQNGIPSIVLDLPKDK